MTDTPLTAAAALKRVLEAAEAPSAHILIVVPDGAAADKIRDVILDRVKGAEARAPSHSILFKTGSWITFLLARNVRPERLAGNQIALSWLHGPERLPDDLRAGWMDSLRLVTRVGDTPDVLITGA